MLARRVFAQTRRVIISLALLLGASRRKYANRGGEKNLVLSPFCSVVHHTTAHEAVGGLRGHRIGYFSAVYSAIRCNMANSSQVQQVRRGTASLSRAISSQLPH